MLNIVSILAIALILATTSGEPVLNDLKNGEFNRYFLYNRNVFGEEISFGGGSNSLIQDNNTVILIHGHRGNHSIPFITRVTRELVQSEELNVIAVDWRIYASLSYSVAQNGVLSIGEHLSAFISNNGINLASTHLIGLDLGAHIAGVAGRRHLGRIARITGLSPTTSNVKLQNTDAGYVEVIHTGTTCRRALADKLGHADFYPNGGAYQPGCWECECDHNRSWMLFYASIRTKTFNANCCNNMSEKDEDTCGGTFLQLGDTRLRKTPCAAGIYRVDTGDVFPF